MWSLAPLLHSLRFSLLAGKELLHLLLLQVRSEVIQHPTWGHTHRANGRIYLYITYSTGLQSKGYNATTDKNDATPSMSDAMRQQEIVDGNTTVCTHCDLEGHTRLPLAGGLEEDCPPHAPISEEGQPDGAAVPPALPQGRDQLGSTTTTTAG